MLISAVPYLLAQNADLCSAISLGTERCSLQCRAASSNSVTPKVIVFLHNTQHACV
jgi:hypothetical protein